MPGRERGVTRRSSHDKIRKVFPSPSFRDDPLGMVRSFAGNEVEFDFRKAFLKHRPQLLVHRVVRAVNHHFPLFLSGLNGCFPLLFPIGLRVCHS